MGAVMMMALGMGREHGLSTRIVVIDSYGGAKHDVTFCPISLADTILYEWVAHSSVHPSPGQDGQSFSSIFVTTLVPSSNI